jgi:hypothetical protein
MPLKWTALKHYDYLRRLPVCSQLLEIGVRQGRRFDTVWRVLSILDVRGGESNIEVNKFV